MAFDSTLFIIYIEEVYGLLLLVKKQSLKLQQHINGWLIIFFNFILTESLFIHDSTRQISKWSQLFQEFIKLTLKNVMRFAGVLKVLLHPHSSFTRLLKLSVPNINLLFTSSLTFQKKRLSWFLSSLFSNSLKITN